MTLILMILMMMMLMMMMLMMMKMMMLMIMMMRTATLAMAATRIAMLINFTMMTIIMLFCDPTMRPVRVASMTHPTHIKHAYGVTAGVSASRQHAVNSAFAALRRGRRELLCRTATICGRRCWHVIAVLWWCNFLQTRVTLLSRSGAPPLSSSSSSSS